VANRVAGLKVDGAEYASQIDYNPSGQARSLLVGPDGTGRTAESYEYDDATGLLNRQKVVSGATPLLDLSYDYLRPGTTGGRTGQLTRVVNNLDPTRRRDRNYEYDQAG
jgi:hypothetical protein